MDYIELFKHTKAVFSFDFHSFLLILGNIPEEDI
mgnify:CR=1 FL=1